ncbi:MAG TPA: chalcone isomerase family protein [Burkholderiales bacterium]|nr:chalcone isomerase family protein [Burkholderiales bacterium]
MRTVTIAIALLLTAIPASAVVVEDVTVPDSITFADQTLVLNGAGVRKRFFVKVYVGALYLPTKESNAETAIAASGAKSVRLHFLHGELEARKLVDAWTDGFKNNHSKTEYDALRPRIERFNAMFRTVKRGETVFVDLLANGDTAVAINNERRGEVNGVDFQKALLKIWLGQKPADEDLKRAMLGAKE